MHAREEPWRSTACLAQHCVLGAALHWSKSGIQPSCRRPWLEHTLALINYYFLYGDKTGGKSVQIIPIYMQTIYGICFLLFLVCEIPTAMQAYSMFRSIPPFLVKHCFYISGYLNDMDKWNWLLTITDLDPETQQITFYKISISVNEQFVVFIIWMGLHRLQIFES